jgi:2-dehydropantoate 2-reductase
MARIAIVGVGAIGGGLAALLDAIGSHEITLCTRRPLLALTVETPSSVVRVRARNVTDPAHAQPVDWVLVATKTYDAAGAATWFPALCANGAPVAVIQNGVEHRERFQQYLSADRLLPIVIDMPVERKEDGKVHIRGNALLKTEVTRLGQSFAALFAATTARTDVRVELTDDFTTAMWWKLCINSVGALNALAMKPAGLLRDESMGRIARAMAADCVAVGRAEGARLSDALPDEVLVYYRKQPPDSVNSLLADRLAGRRTEWDARNGAIVRKGEKHGIDTPLNRMAAALLEAAEPNAG